MAKVKCALIGAGGMANGVHYPSVTSLDDVEIVGLCDLDAEKLKATAEKFRIPRTFTSYKAMLDETKPDAVYALMPPHVLFDVAMDILQRGHHLFVEKPPAVTTFQTECLARMAERKGLVTAVGFQRRYHPLVSRCWEEVRKVGPINQVVSCFYKCQPTKEPYDYYRGAIDVLRCDAIHAVDALRYFAGLAEVKAVASEVRKVDCWAPVSFNSLVYFENGVVGVLLVNWLTGRRTFKFEFHARDASAYADIDGRGEVWVANGKEPAFASTHTEFVKSTETHVHQGFLAESRAFIDAVKTGRQLHNNLQDAVRSMALADRIYQSAINAG